MKIKEGFVLKRVADINIIVPINDPKFKSILTLNDSGAFLFGKMTEETDKQSIKKELINEYGCDEQTAETDVTEFIESLQKAGILDE